MYSTMPFNVSEEQSLLSSMLAERDAQISTLTHQLHSTSEILHATQKELQSKSSARKSQREEHSATIKRLKEEHADQRRVLAKFEQNVKNGGGLRVHEYAALMRSANGSGVESSYVLRLQAQLCRAMHSLGVMESQLALVKENCSSLIKFMKEDLSHMVDDRTRREIELMNGLARVDSEKRVMAEEMELKMQEKEDLLDQVREEYEELGLEYDENEVKKALEVKYLLEQMEKVREDKVRLEKELLAALLEREEQINRLREETEELGAKLDGLKKKAEKRDIRYGEDVVAVVSEESNDGRVAQEEEDAVQRDAYAKGGGEKVGEVNDGQDDTVTDAASRADGEGGKGMEDTERQDDAVVGVKSQLVNDTMNETPAAKGTELVNNKEGRKNGGIDSNKIDTVGEATSRDVQMGGGEEVTANDSSTDDANMDEKAAASEAVENQIPTNEDDGNDESKGVEGTLQTTQEESVEVPTTATADDANIDEKMTDSEPVGKLATPNEKVEEANAMELSGNNNDDIVLDEGDSEQPQQKLPVEDASLGKMNKDVDSTPDVSSAAVEENDAL